MIKKVLGGFGTIAGATYPLRALILFIRHPKLLGYILIPIILNLIIAIALYSALLFFGLEFIADIQLDISTRLSQLIANLPAWLSILDYGISGLILLLQFLLTITLFVATGFILTQFGVLLGAPWYGELSEKLEKIRTGNVEIIEVSLAKDLSRAILYELKKIVLMIIVGIPLSIMNLFPGIGTLIVAAGWFSLTTAIIGLDFMDSALERRRLKFRRKLKLMINNLPASASFALVCFFLISIPLINLFTIPLCVASGTLFVCDRLLPIEP
ncbi:MAG: EI24 domain-containing protein [Cyanobacteria bacterium P01_F01_bin.143]